MSNNNAPDDDGGWPDELFRKMKEGHDKFMRDLDPRPASDARQHDSTPSSSDDRKGLLLVFKDLVDTTAAGFSDIARNISQFPSNISDLRGKMQREQAQRREEEMDSWRRWTGHEASPDHVQMIMDRAALVDKAEALDAAICLVQESARRNEGVDLKKIQDLFREPSRTDPLGLFDVLEFDEANRWLGVEWFRRNAYSPIRLEAHPDACTQGTRWREAFEDLLKVSLDKPMGSYEKVGVRMNGNVQSTMYGPGLDWMLSLQCRGILPPQLPTFWQKLDVQKSRGSLQDSIALYLIQKTQRSGNGVRQDSQFYDLVREISTPAPEQSYQPDMAVCPMLGASAPEVEQDLYDALHRRDEPDRDDMADEMIQLATEQRKMSSSTDGQGAPSDWPTYGTQSMEELAEALHSFHHEQWRQEYEDDDASELPQQTTKEVPTPSSISSSQMSLDRDIDAQLARDRLSALVQQADALSFDKSIAKEVVEVPSHASKVDDHATTKVDVLSSLTTTQTTRLPDGTVTTKVMLKQRFADGREETHEKVHTYQDHARVQRNEESEQDEQPRKKGWFWL